MIKTKVIFIRHGEARGNIDRNFHGHHDSDLTENGKVQIQLLAKRLKGEIIDIIYSSDLKRTKQTAKAVAEYHGLKVLTDPRLREIYGGEWEDVPWDDLPIRFPESYGYWLANPAKLQMPSGESMIEFLERLSGAVEDIVRRNTGKNICISTHGTGIKALLSKYHGKTLSDMPNMAWHDNASFTVVEFDGDMNAAVISEGDNTHLGDTGTLAKQTWWKKV